MKVSLRQEGAPFRFVGTNATGDTLTTDISQADGGTEDGVRPLELLLFALGSCSMVDVISILKKGRQEVESVSVDVSAERDGGKPISMITSLHAHFVVEGTAEPDRIRRAIRLSMGTYCTVTRVLEKAVPISASFEIGGVRHEA